MTMLIQLPAPSEAALLLCEMGPRVADRTLTLTECSGTETKSIILSAASPDSAKFRAMSARILRLVTSRQPVGFVSDSFDGQILAYVRETLECGHSQVYYFIEEIEPLTAKRRVCHECTGANQKKPPQSVTSIRERRAA